MNISRRHLCALLPLLAAAPALAEGPEQLQSIALPFAELPMHQTGAGMEMRPLLHGHSYGGTEVEAHETVLPSGASPHPPHRHQHIEIFFVMRGNVTVIINGHESKLGPGSAAYMAGNDLHGVRNDGKEPAQYFVISLGPKDL